MSSALFDHLWCEARVRDRDVISESVRLLSDWPDRNEGVVCLSALKICHELKVCSCRLDAAIAAISERHPSPSAERRSGYSNLGEFVSSLLVALLVKTVLEGDQEEDNESDL